jgi:hypothetical protein
MSNAESGPDIGSDFPPERDIADIETSVDAGSHVAGAVRTLIESRSEFQNALRNAFAQAAETGCRELWLCDVNYAQWPLGEIKVVEALTKWAYAHRKLTLFAYDFEEFNRRHSRWVEWRRHWAHVVECRQLNELEVTQVPTLLFAPGMVTVRLFDPIHYRGTISALPLDAVNARELLDAIAQRSEEAFPATTLGL